MALLPEIYDRAARVLGIPVLGPVILPLWSLCFKFLRMEGALLAVNLTLCLRVDFKDWENFLLRMVLSTLTLAQLYGFNDACDAAGDVNDPDKPRPVAKAIARRQGQFIAGSVAWVPGLVIFAYLLLPQSLPGVISVVCVNMAYSLLFKGVAIADIFIVCIWGACFAFVTGMNIPKDLLVAVGTMTGISHTWQILRDQDADAAQGIRTSAVFSRMYSLLAVIFLSATLAMLAYSRAGILAGTLSLTPIVLYFAKTQIYKVWILSKLVFAVIWWRMLP